MLTPGPSSTLTCSATQACPSASPTASSSPLFQLLARPTAVGKQMAGTLSLRPMWSLSPCCLRRPWGPSVSQIEGRLNRSTPCSSQNVRPVQRDAFSTLLNCRTMSVAVSLCTLSSSSGVGEFIMFGTSSLWLGWLQAVDQDGDQVRH